MNCKLYRLAAITALGVALLATNPWFSVLDDEANVLVTAVQPAPTTLAQFTHGHGEHEHPPLFDILLHYWLWLTNSNLKLTRVMPVLFYLGGLWILIDTAAMIVRRSGGRAAPASVWLALLWPFGFHYGRVANWYSFAFFLAALLTWQWEKLQQEWKMRQIAGFFLAALALVYTSYFAWALLACLTLDFFLRSDRRMIPHYRRLSLLAGLPALALVALSVPLFRSFSFELQNRLPMAGPSLLSRTLYGCFNLYTTFVSEAVAPWCWPLSVVAAAAIVVAVWLLLRRGGPTKQNAAQRYFLYFLALLAVMSALDIANPKRLLLIGGWLVLPLMLAAGRTATDSPGVQSSRWFGCAIVVLLAVGWFGIVSRRFYAAPHFLEPWREVARAAAAEVNRGGEVIGNSFPFFFYLSYELGQPRTVFDWRPMDFRDAIHPRVFHFSRWLEAGRPLSPQVMLVQGTDLGESSEEPMQFTAQFLASHCRAMEDARFLRNPGYEWKRRFFPESGQLPWRIEVTTYTCR